MAERHLQVAALIDMNMDVLSVTMATAAGGVQDAAPARFLFNSRLMSRRRYIFFFSLLFFLFHVEQEMTDNTDLRKKKSQVKSTRSSTVSLPQQPQSSVFEAVMCTRC